MRALSSASSQATGATDRNHERGSFTLQPRANCDRKRRSFS
jgi:hypothetical protein